MTRLIYYGTRNPSFFGGVAEWLKAAVLKTVECQSSVGSNPTSSAIIHGEMAELAEGARLLSE